jgi:ADP-ribose pyrophosphatase YjhB (NUDIX family)
MKVLMLKSNNEEGWYLPGGFVLKKEPIENAADRILKERTGIDKYFCSNFTFLATRTVQNFITRCIRICCPKIKTFSPSVLYL